MHDRASSLPHLLESDESSGASGRARSSYNNRAALLKCCPSVPITPRLQRLRGQVTTLKTSLEHICSLEIHLRRLSNWKQLFDPELDNKICLWIWVQGVRKKSLFFWNLGISDNKSLCFSLFSLIMLLFFLHLICLPFFLYSKSLEALLLLYFGAKWSFIKSLDSRDIYQF